MRKSVVIALACAIPLVLFACGDSSDDSSSIPDLDPGKYPTVQKTSAEYIAADNAMDAVKTAYAYALIDASGDDSDEVANKTSEMITHRAPKLTSGESGTYTLNWSKTGITVKGTFTGEEEKYVADVTVTFTDYTYSNYTFNGTAHYLINSESGDEMKYYYDADITYAKGSESHTIKFQYRYDVTKDGYTYKAIYDFDGTKYGESYQYPETTTVSKK